MNDARPKPIILCVDDNPFNLSVLFEFLNTSGFEILIAQDGHTALSRAKLVSPDLILLDIMMPEIDGFQTCEALKSYSETKHIPIIFMTAVTDTVSKIRGFELGAVDYITKPFQQGEVLARIHTHLTLVRQQQELYKKNQFFSIVSHDMRNMFNILQGTIELLINRSTSIQDQKIEKYAQNLMNISHKAHKMMENLQYWASIQTGHVKQIRKPLCLYERINETVLLLTEFIKDKQIEIINEINQNVNVFADLHMLDTVLRNLISNAIKFSHPNQSIIIRQLEGNIEVNEPVVHIAVIDKGIGITQEQLDKLFIITQRVQTVGTRGEKGSGLGLILCRELVSQMAGTMGVDSQLGKGSTFWFTIPISTS
ncbi:MAG: hybrid sensor histidine kinase/response regulator [Desulfobacterales bacterium]|nr:hybrid sensor histidine kinase/response regulator [Desulfobacterales bacterium]